MKIKASPLKLEVDAYPKGNSKATSVTLPAATGARFALLPPRQRQRNFIETDGVV
jgi:multidrug resistance efflux pump